MTIDGDWNLKLDGPSGQQDLVLTINGTEGEGFSGSLYSGLLGSELEVTDIELAGDQLTWSSSMTTPIALKMAFQATIDGDQISGDTQAGDMGEFKFTGAKA